jgi:hypothetical protein
MFMKKLLALIGLLAVLTSCASIGERMSRISPGMTKPEVVRILGKPDSSGGSSGVEVLHYKQDEGWWRFSYYFVRVVDGKVESYGPETRGNPVTASNPSLKK